MTWQRGSLHPKTAGCCPSWWTSWPTFPLIAVPIRICRIRSRVLKWLGEGPDLLRLSDQEKEPYLAILKDVYQVRGSEPGHHSGSATARPDGRREPVETACTGDRGYRSDGRRSQAAARRALPPLQEQLARERRADTLLRASLEPAPASSTLLRPVIGSDAECMQMNCRARHFLRAKTQAELGQQLSPDRSVPLFAGAWHSLTRNRDYGNTQVIIETMLIRSRDADCGWRCKSRLKAAI